MIKKFFLLLVLIICVSCSEDKNGYTMNASIDGVNDSTKVFLNVVEDKQLKAIDSALIKDKAFTFTGTVVEPDIHFITIEGLRANVPVILENTDMTLTMYKDSLQKTVITGSKENDLLQEYTNHVSNSRKELQKTQLFFRNARDAQDSLKMAQNKAAYDNLVIKHSEYDVKFIEENSNHLMSVFVLERILNNKSQEAKTVQELFDKLPKNLQESRTGKSISETLVKSLATAIGSIAPNFSAPTPEGEMLALHDIKGKVTIIDFWAAWCGPCRRENPNVVKVYDRFHDKGLEIIGVSLDGNSRQQDPKAAWLQAIKDDKLTWHHVSDLKYFNSEPAKLYNITSIPATFILDSEGKIVAKNLRGQALEDKIAELLN